MRRTLCEAMPPPLPGFGKRVLKDVLGRFPNQDRKQLTVPMQRNLRDAETKVRSMVRLKKLALSDLVVIPIDRKVGTVSYKQGLTVNCAPTLTTHNVYLTVLTHTHPHTHAHTKTHAQYEVLFVSPVFLILLCAPPPPANISFAVVWYCLPCLYFSDLRQPPDYR